MNYYDYDMMLRLLSHGVYSYKELYHVMQAHDFNIDESFHDEFIKFSEIYLTPLRASNRHIMFKPIYYLNRKFFLRKVLFKFNGFNEFVYFLSSSDLNLFHDYLCSKLSFFLSSRGLSFDYNKTYAGSLISYDFLLPGFALEVETGLKGGNYSDLSRRLGISPFPHENVNKRFNHSPFIYILVPNDSVKNQYFKHFLALSDKFGYSVFATYKFNISTFSEFENVNLLA